MPMSPTCCKREIDTIEPNYSIDDEAINVANLFIGNFYTLNQIKDLKKCPKCGSRATEQKKVYFWIDKKGNCVDVEE